jgi:hypothetical protein
MCTENHVCFGRIHGSQLREGANAGQHTPTLSLPPSHHCLDGEVYRGCTHVYMVWHSVYVTIPIPGMLLWQYRVLPVPGTNNGRVHAWTSTRYYHHTWYHMVASTRSLYVFLSISIVVFEMYWSTKALEYIPLHTCTNGTNGTFWYAIRRNMTGVPLRTSTIPWYHGTY